MDESLYINFLLTNCVFIFQIIGCNYGQYWDPSSDSCFVCPIGTYSDTLSTDESCTPCSDGQTTTGEGSNGLNECRPCRKLCILSYFKIL